MIEQILNWKLVFRGVLMQRTADLFKKFIAVVISAALSVTMISGLFADHVSADTTKTFNLSFKVDSQSARNMLSLINGWRTGGNAWYWNEGNKTKHQCGVLSAYTYDYNLEKIAQQRAYEAAIHFAHKRPNGKQWITCKAGNTETCAECLAAGSATTAGAFELWQENDCDFDGQGHRRAMLDPGYTSIGIAHVEYQGTHFWVQEYGYKNSGAGETSALSGTVNASVEVDLSLFTLTLSSFSDMEVELDTVNALPEVKGYLVSDNTWGIDGIPVNLKDYPVTWTSDDTSIVTVEGSTFRAVGYGYCYLTATVNWGGEDCSEEMSVCVFDPNLNGLKTEEDGKTYYYLKGVRQVGWKTVGGSKYYFDIITGAATTGVKKISGKYYLFASNGVMQKNGWKSDGKGNTYYLKKSGAAYTKKWVKKKKKKKRKWYYFGSNGKMVKGKTIKIGKRRYKFKKNGVCRNRR